VVAEDRDDWDLDEGHDLAREIPRLVGQAVVGQVAAEQHRIGARLGEVAEHGLKGAL
jgi:hypothetical protein